MGCLRYDKSRREQKMVSALANELNELNEEVTPMNSAKKAGAKLDSM